MQQHIQYYRMAALCEALCEAVNRCYVTHQARVGAPSMTAELKAQGFTMSMRTIGRVMQCLGLRAKSSRQFKCTTDSHHKFGASPNLLNRVLTVSKPNQVWVGDIPYIRTDADWLHLVVMLDLYSRQVVGW